MVNLNLLPWREYEAVYQKKIVKRFVALSLLLPFLMWLILHMWLADQLRKVQSHIAALGDLSRHYVLPPQKRQTKEPGPPPTTTALLPSAQHSFHALFQALGRSDKDDQVCFNEIKGNQHTVYFIGQTPSSADLMEFVRHWNAAALFSELRIKNIERQRNGDMQFIFLGIRE